MVTNRIRTHFSYANVMSTLAVFIVLGGGAYAATKLPKNSVGTTQLKNNAVTSPKVKDGSLVAKDFKTGQLPAGAAGAKGDKGDTGLQGPKGDKGDKGDTGATGPSTGAAGGSLAGNYPNPTIAAGAVGTEQLARAPFTFSDQMKDTSITQGDGTFERVDFDVPTAIANGITTTTTADASSLTVSTAGLYLISGYARWTSNADGTYRQLIVKRTGTSADLNVMNDVDNGIAAGATHSFSGAVPMVPGDSIIVTAGQNSGMAKTIQFAISAVRISG